MELKEKLTALRRQRGMSQQELADRLCVSRQAVSGWERGAAVPSADNLAGLGRLFGVPVDALLNGSLPEPPPMTETARAVQRAPSLPVRCAAILAWAVSALLTVSACAYAVWQYWYTLQ